MKHPKHSVSGKTCGVSNGDAALRAVLRAWPAVEPSPGFEVEVWRRLQCEEAKSERIVIRWFTHARPVRAAAAALVAGALLGAMLARQTVPPVSAVHRSGAMLLHTETLAGSYLGLVAGGGP